MLALKTESRVAGEHGVLHEKNLEEQEKTLKSKRQVLYFECY